MNQPKRSAIRAALTCTAVATAALFACVSPPASAAYGDRSGKDVVDTVCAACHASGANGAPRIGDRAAWSVRAARGLTGLTQSALNGIREMPAHGGNPGLSDVEIERAITYMVNASGGHWSEPISRAALPAERSGERIVQAYCVACHEAGLGGAPRVGDLAAWVPRMKQGLDPLTRSAINGHGGMPPRGGVASLTDKELRSAIAYMLNPVTTAVAASPPDTSASEGPNHHAVGGVDVYFGMTSAEALRAQHPGNDVESRMHGAIPRGRGYYHVTVALFDRRTGAPIIDADVEATVVGTSTRTEVKVLEPMVLNDTVSFGNYVRLPSAKDPYTIAVAIRLPGEPRPVETKFAFQR
jgi:cytochrome c5